MNVNHLNDTITETLIKAAKISLKLKKVSTQSKAPAPKWFTKELKHAKKTVNKLGKQLSIDPNNGLLYNKYCKARREYKVPVEEIKSLWATK